MGIGGTHMFEYNVSKDMKRKNITVIKEGFHHVF